MNLSALLWGSLARLPLPLAARLGSIVCRDRQFSVDGGHWVNRQAEATFVSPDIHAQRLSYVTAKVRDEWFWATEPSGIVFDIGAGIGEEAVVMSPLATHVYAIEAHPDVFACLVETVKRSGLTNVTPIHCALADRDGEVRIETGDHHLASSIGAGKGIPVPARSLQSLCAEHGIEQVDFLKMNIEGAERLAVKGFGDVPIRDLAISCHDFVADRGADGDGTFFRTRKAVTRYLTSHGYTIRTRDGHERPWTRDTLYAHK
jgi:FkbM family methyltransferase